MSVRVALHHRTEYRYDRPVMLSPQVIRLRPAPHCRTAIRSYALKISPGDHFLNWQQDPFSNYLARVVFPGRTDHFTVEVDVVADMVVINPFDFFLDDQALEYPFSYAQEVAEELRPYLRVGPPGPRMQNYLARIPRTKVHSLQFLTDLNKRVHEEVAYVIREEPGVQTPEETLTLRSGSCRDSAWLLVQTLRHFGIASRFVSGYLIQLAADERPLDGPAGPLTDFTDLHAWAEAYLPGAGWVGLDATSGLLAAEGHLPLACSPEPSSAAAITGATEKCECTFGFEMKVQRIYETPRVSKPFTEEVWLEINALAERVDEDLVAHDVRLTMGGEPTFVSLDDRDGDEWHTAAAGPEKRRLGLNLLDRLAEEFAPKGLHHHGEGKWYPGESLPRWSLDCYWLRDGTPLWQDPALRGDARRDYGHGSAEAERFVKALCRRLQVPEKFAVSAYEDVFYYLWRERRLPVNVDPFDSKLEEKEERARLMKVFTQGLDHLVGYALPLRPRAKNGGWHWESGPWFLREERMYLFPGDSPMGLRLPLDSLPWEAAADRHQVIWPDPMAWPSRERAGTATGAATGAPAQAHPGHPQWPGTGPLSARIMRQNPLTGAHATAVETLQHAPYFTEEGGPLIRTALCVEAREGRLHTFMPPVPTAEHYFALIAAIEATAGETGLPVIVEGYKPPFHPDLMNFSIRPDPGVLEVNIHPATSWAELRHINTVLYEQARQCRLSAEKYALDGRATGTGGGGHVVMGGPSPADSPFLRRPDLLRSMLGFWHNHPGLSYLFTGLFVGPTCQAPRVDEARDDMVPELEIAFDQIENEAPVAPWLVDRLFRNLLVDVTGNTHRAEFCIDKLFAPETAEGRRGLVEMRAFEMPPHPRMALLQHALVRALIATFWQDPYEERLIRWQTALHDRFMLPHFIWTDFCDVLDYLGRHGYGFEREWFLPQFTFRFPKYGEIAHDGVRLELRAALEPWPVLGEQPAGGGTVRFVDYSLDRVEVLVRGLVDPRHAVACNGVRVPLHPTGTVGEYVAGVRYRAWWPPESLHPNLPTNTPLVFDIVDTWNRRALGGCTLWASHPGGRNYETFPVNGNEAEARRAARFAPIGHTPGLTHLHPTRSHPEYPMTLDLRR